MKDMPVEQSPISVASCKGGARLHSGSRWPRRVCPPAVRIVAVLVGCALFGAVPAAAQEVSPAAQAGTDSAVGGTTSRTRWFPGSSLAPRLRGPPRETRIEGGLIVVDRDAVDAQLGDVEALVAFGYRLAVIRLAEPGEGRPGFDLSLDAGVFSRFSPQASALGLIEADFRVGFPVGMAVGAWGARAGWVHSSSHLGDDFLREFPGTPFEDRISGNGFEVLITRRFAGAWRAYAGADFNYDTTPTVASVAGRVGIEWEPLAAGAAVSPNAALDLELTDLTDRLAGTGAIGVLFRTRPVLQLNVVGHFGPSPMGHFRLVDETYAGIVLTIGP